MSTDSAPPKFPAGEFSAPDSIDETLKAVLIQKLAEAPSRVRAAVDGLSDEQLDTKYKNWTIRQIVHHLADSHMNCYVRFKWALTEASPLIKSYNETAWSEVADAKSTPLESSLLILDGLHSRWVSLIEQLTDDQLKKTFFHPEQMKDVVLLDCLASYAWHVDHHLAQVEWVKNQ